MLRLLAGLAMVGGGAARLCPFTHDGDCDDGRPGAHTSLCRFGTDTYDCLHMTMRGGNRRGGSNTCAFRNDGECDDGRPGAHTSMCLRGTDANDCDSNTCGFAFDGECDDGRPGAHTSMCSPGTDSNDCNSYSYRYSGSLEELSRKFPVGFPVAAVCSMSLVVLMVYAVARRVRRSRALAPKECEHAVLATEETEDSALVAAEDEEDSATESEECTVLAATV
eukprot:COSAG02_NODE_5781_length_4038_cov_145.567911_3_plen_222_part_00